MTDIQLPYGKTTLKATIPDTYSVTQLLPAQVVAAENPLEVVQQALDNPIGGKLLDDFTEIQSVAIAINDKTRPVPHQHLLPPLLEKLAAMGIQPDNIHLIIATGTHPVMPPEEYAWILPDDIIATYPIHCHDGYADETHEYLGETSRGTPVYINKHYMQADLKIVIGNIDPHQFQGFSGGVKSAAIGLAGAKTINHNHAMMTDAASRLGEYADNPARQDVEAIGRIIGVDFAVNALLNSKKQIVEVFAGDPYAVMEAAIPRVKALYQLALDAPFDLMLVSPGGYPKDLNVYQTQKGMAHAALATKKGGTMILCAACPEGTGSDKYEKWIMNDAMNSHEAVIAEFTNQGFQVGPHKAFQISRDAADLTILLLSEMQSDFVEKLLLHPISDLQAAIDSVLPDLPSDARIGVLPSANSTIPVVG
ncbi:MAG: nickel-dependent lactate racemase [Aggregatilineales bacterium]